MIHVFIKHVGEQETIFFRIGNSNNIVIDLQKCNTTGYKGVSFSSEFKTFQSNHNQSIHLIRPTQSAQRFCL